MSTGHHHHACDGHGHEHAHAPGSFGVAFAVGTALNVAFVLAEAVFGFFANSMALLADAGHNLGDVLGLIAAWAASALMRWLPTKSYTYGLRSASILAALFNAVILLVAVGAIAVEAIRRFFEPAETAGTTVMIVAGIGIVVNGATAWLFMSGRHHDLNVRGAFLHMAADGGVSLGTVVAGGIILLTGWPWIDPTVSLVIAAVILWSSWGLLRESVSMSLQGVPAGIDASKVQGHLESLPGVTGVHDLHIWPMSTTQTALTCHLVMPGGHPGDTFIARVIEEVHCQFGIEHTTVQIEIGDAGACAFEPDHVV